MRQFAKCDGHDAAVSLCAYTYAREADCFVSVSRAFFCVVLTAFVVKQDKRREQEVMRFTRNKLSILLAVMMCLVLVTSASADILYGAMSGGWTTDQIGIITGNSAPKQGLVTNLGATAGARVSSFRTENGGSRVAFCEYSVVNNPNGGDNILIWNPYNTDWKNPLKELPMDKNPVSNVRGMAFSGKYLYACGYDYATVARFDMTNDAYTNDKTYNAINDGEHHAEAIVTYKDYVYVVVTRHHPATGPARG